VDPRNLTAYAGYQTFDHAQSVHREIKNEDSFTKGLTTEGDLTNKWQEDFMFYEKEHENDGKFKGQWLKFKQQKASNVSTHTRNNMHKIEKADLGKSRLVTKGKVGS
jgi:hypothetical protein